MNAATTSAVAANETIGYGSQPPSPNSAVSVNTTSAAGAPSTTSARGERRHSACVSATSASSTPATGLAAALSTASAPARAQRRRANASIAARANDTPFANAGRPIHTSPTAAAANATAAHRAGPPSRARVRPSKHATDASTDSPPTTRSPSSHASGPNRTLYPGN